MDIFFNKIYQKFHYNFVRDNEEQQDLSKQPNNNNSNKIKPPNLMEP